MLPRLHRLQKSKDIELVIRKGYRERLPQACVQLSYLPNNEKSSRFAFVVSNKIHKRATKRNRAKRLMREAVRSYIPLLKSGYDMIIWATPAVLHADFDQVRKDICTTFEKARLFTAIPNEEPKE